MPPSNPTKNPHKRQFRHKASSQVHSSQPSLPSTVQSSLLSLGMRIRKSIPEGYKNQEKAFPHVKSTSCYPENHKTSTQLGGSSLPSILQSRRQPLSFRSRSHMFPIPTSTPSEEDLPTLLFDNGNGYDLEPSSQESKASITTDKLKDAALVPLNKGTSQRPNEFLRPNLKKRAREEDDDERDEDIGPKTLGDVDMIYSDTAADNSNDGEEPCFRPSPSTSYMLRPITQPHRRRFCAAVDGSTNKQKRPQGFSQEPDFEEAAFLRMED